MTDISIYYQEDDGRNRGLVEAIIQQHGGKITGSGVFLPTMERDIGAEVPAANAKRCIRALQDRGLRVERMR